MASVWNKIDSGLSRIYANFLRSRDPRTAGLVTPDPIVAQGRRLHVSLRYQGTIVPAEQAGFKTVWNDGHGQATGSISLDDLPAIAQPDSVLTIRFGQPHHIHLETSVPQIRANKVWSVVGGVFGGETGDKALVAVIDSGVDIYHKYLWRQTIPTPATRILRIWDMGLEKVGAETAPDAELLDPGAGGTYGVEYKEKQINDFINGVKGALPIRHKDCNGHGTHVASIAAGDGGPKFEKVGVAPRANLIIVKFSDLMDPPDVNGVLVGDDQMFKDAVTYVRKVADKLGKDALGNPVAMPVAINYSRGSTGGPNDGLTEQEDWLSAQFADANSQGKVFVVAAGNEAGQRTHARVEFTAANQTIELPLDLKDDQASFAKREKCDWVDSNHDLVINCYYPNAGAVLSFALKPQGKLTSEAGPVLGRKPIPGFVEGREYTLFHSEEPDNMIKRNVAQILLKPHTVDRHLPGRYVVELTASAPMTVHVWCARSTSSQSISLAKSLPAGVFWDDTCLIGQPAGAANVITVAAYDAHVAAGFPVWENSSRGPLARHGVGGDAPPKPEIAAPGVQVYAAQSQDRQPQNLINDFIPLNGTSFSAPHVTGAVALMLHKNKTLKPSEVLKILQKWALKAPPPVANEVGAGRLDVEAAFSKTSKGP